MTIAQAVDRLISQSPFMEEALTDGLVNVSSYARSLLPDVQKLVGKRVQVAAIVMAINRRSPGYYLGISRGIKSFMSGLGDIIVRSDLCDHTFTNSPSLTSRQQELMAAVAGQKDVICTLSQGVYETTIVASGSLDGQINKLFAGESRVSHKRGLCSLTIRLPTDNTEVSGVYYFILKNLAWIGVNICEVISTSNEITLVVSSADVHRAFEVLMGLKGSKYQ